MFLRFSLVFSKRPRKGRTGLGASEIAIALCDRKT